MFNGSCFREGITRPGVKRDHMEAVCQAVGQTSQSPLAGGVKEIFHLQYRELTLPEKVSDLWCFHKLFIVIFTFSFLVQRLESLPVVVVEYYI